MTLRIAGVIGQERETPGTGGVYGPAVLGLIWEGMPLLEVFVLILREGVEYKALPEKLGEAC